MTLIINPSTTSLDDIRRIRPHQRSHDLAKYYFIIFFSIKSVLHSAYSFLAFSSINFVSTIYIPYSSLVIFFHRLKSSFLHLFSLKHSSNNLSCCLVHKLLGCLRFCIVCIFFFISIRLIIVLGLIPPFNLFVFKFMLNKVF